MEEGSAQEEQLRCDAQHDDEDDGYTGYTGYTDHDDQDDMGGRLCVVGQC